MLKNIIFFIEFLAILIFVLVLFLLNGFTLSNLSHENINIPQLYIKYDKKLIVKINKLTIKDDNTNKSYSFRVDFDLISKKDKYILNINDFQFNNYKLQLKSKIILSQKQIDDLINLNIKNLELKDFSFKFDNKLKAIKTKSTFITYKNNNIFFKLKKPTLDNIKLDKSSVALKNINKSMFLDLDLYINNKIDKKLLKIIEHYGVNLPIVQYSGKNNIFVKAIVPFFDLNKVDVYVKVKSTNAKILYSNILSKTKNLSVEYKNKIINIQAKNGFANINNKDIYFSSMNLKYENKIFDIDANSGKIDIFDKNISFNKLKVKLKNGILDIKSENGDLFLNKQNINYKNLILKINKNIVNVKTSISNNDASIDIKTYINMKKKISNGEIFVKSAKYKNLIELKNKNINFDLNYQNNKVDLKLENEKIYYKYDGFSKHTIKAEKIGILLNKIDFLTKIDNTKANLIINSFDDFNNTDVYINNIKLNINHDKFSKFQFDKKEKSNKRKININIKNSIIGYDKRYIDIKNSDIQINENKIYINIEPKHESSNIKIYKNKDSIKIKANKISSNLINRLLKSEKLKGGYIDLTLVGNNISLSGNVKFKNNIVKNVRALNNLIAFINTTPAYFNPLLALPTLFRLGEVGFDMNGYFISKGGFNFVYNIQDKVLNINSLHTKGKMADFNGKVKSDFKNKKITANLDVVFLKDYSKFIDHIPILGYIIVGEDGNFLTKVDLDGNFEKQTFKTHVLDDSLNGILNVIKRTISIPLLPFLKKKKE